MKNNKINFTVICAALALLFSLIITGCYTPSPLYGTWKDNLGNKIVFTSDGSFTASVYETSDEATSYSGSFDVIDNAIIFSASSDKSTGTTTKYTTWDIHGAVLTLKWIAADSTTITLTLYHTAR